jgi:predicted membrane protein
LFAEITMRRFSILLLALFALRLSAAPPQHIGNMAQVGKPEAPTITVFDAPDAGTEAMQGTVGFSINSLGDIAGGYIAAGNSNVSYGFVRVAATGAINEFHAPDAGSSQNQGTFPFSISSKDVITGMYADANNVYHGFVRASSGTITEFDVPGAGTGGHRGTTPTSINTGGVIAGAYDTGTYQTTSVWHGFVRTAKGKITTFDAPGAGTGNKQGTQPPLSINNVGTITGTYRDSNYVHHGFVRTNAGVMTTFDAPGAGTNPGQHKGLQFQGTIPTAINAKGVIIGVYSDTNFANHGFVRAADGTITSFDVSGAGGSGLPGTIPGSVNTAGTIAGLYSDTNGVFHGFVRTAKGVITTFDVPGAGGSGFLQGSGAFSINTKGTIAGTYVDANNVVHGFLRTPK